MFWAFGEGGGGVSQCTIKVFLPLLLTVLTWEKVPGSLCLHSFDVRIQEHGSLGTRLVSARYAPALNIRVFSRAQMKFLTLKIFQSNLCSWLSRHTWALIHSNMSPTVFASIISETWVSGWWTIGWPKNRFHESYSLTVQVWVCCPVTIISQWIPLCNVPSYKPRSVRNRPVYIKTAAAKVKWPSITFI